MPLSAWDTIAVTAPSSGVPAALQPRLDVAIADLLEVTGMEALEATDALPPVG